VGGWYLVGIWPAGRVRVVVFAFKFLPSIGAKQLYQTGYLLYINKMIYLPCRSINLKEAPACSLVNCGPGAFLMRSGPAVFDASTYKIGSTGFKSRQYL
jgi:hypothetical protein